MSGDYLTRYNKWRKSKNCKDCGIIINRYNLSSRCKSCSDKYRVGKKKNPKILDGQCQRCKIEFKYYAAPYRGFPKKFCSIQCYKQTRIEKATKICTECKKEFFKGKVTRMNIVCSRECYGNRRKRLYIGKDHHGFKDGKQVFMGKVETAAYRKALIDKIGYPMCEQCGINQSIAWEVHHIVFRSEKPKHKNLHNHRNLIHICFDCHRKFHGQKGKELRQPLIKERGLEELFESQFTVLRR